MHCLPAYRGFEITDKVFETHAETIMNQAENRLHFQRTVLSILMGEGGIA
jgi:ornithine carbamoyltransferase